MRADPASARLHGSVNLDAIAGSLARFGQAEPLVVQRGSNRVIAENGRLTAMQKLGWSECDVVVTTRLTVETVSVDRIFCSPVNSRCNAAAVPHVAASSRRSDSDSREPGDVALRKVA